MAGLKGQRESIEETTVGMLGEVRVPMGNMTHGRYRRADGQEDTGRICALALPTGTIFVGEGSEIEVGGSRWRVLAVDKSPGELGAVSLECVG